ncbi:ethylene-insensitive protein 2-like isoform X1 [Cucurbita pepo subsp. pepo]|uniref:ethylene-insensitive protein 2-like isoform X1 n=1 Tax=Cucurbita pepo subsp. pepo TaxID=3664 RepID=UPI000C9DA28B|nr:ethylene-insensitive protein 2-like isoform X1 [Cucurbita pepo subsp. pepo]XP_023517108.1 ethylene-insensitive protein 2-like isoform X1 [Cucurbita pepo subsp. pepo]XP_023517109.1 ethylene-insensitive protein 2-like isoform X1 [Cucurbita pepo subsp. pepo]
MESTTSHTNHLSGAFHRFMPFIAPALLVSISYVDPGKWAATVEGGARFGFDLFVLVLLFNLAAILCQYLSASIGVVTGRGLAQICSEEYDKCTCLFLGIQAEVSVILLDLTMILGISHGLNLLLGWDLFTCVLLTGVVAALFPLFANLLEDGRAKFMYICMAGFVLLSLVLGVLISQPEIPLSMNLMLTRLNGESAFTLMSLLGASVMPHNFYVHSSIVQQQQQSPPNISKEVLCNNHLFAIVCIFSGIYVVNNVLMNSAANVFYSSGLALHTFPDALSLMEQVFRSPMVYVLFLLVLFLSNQITALTWSLGGQLVLTNFLKLDIPGWLHCATIRLIAIIPALYCVWSSGAEGMYQLLIFSQVMVALLLPSSVIPLFRVASSRPIMGAFKISQLVEFIAIVIFVGILGLKIVFVVEMFFGNSDWVVNLRWNMGSGLSIPYVVLLITACSAFCLMLWLAATPLKSATAIAQLDAQVLNWDVPEVKPDSAVEREGIDLGKGSYSAEPIASHSDLSVPEFDFDLPENIMEPVQVLDSINQGETQSSSVVPSSPKYVSENLISTELVSSSTVVTHDVPDSTLADKKVLKIDSVEPVEKTVGFDGDLRSEKDSYEVDNWEAEEPLKEISGCLPSSTSEGPGSFRSLSGKSEEGGNGTGSLSRLAGLGRAARRQLTAILDEFWGQLYDFHGVATQDAKDKKLDLLLGIDSKLVTSSLKSDAVGKDSPYSSPLGSKASNPISSGLYDSPKSLRVQSGLDSPYGVQKGHQPMWSNHVQLFDQYVNNSSHNGLDSGVKRYSSLRSLPSSESWDHQPATVHGSQLTYLSRMAKDKSSGHLNGQLDPSASKYHTLGGAGGASLRDSVAFAMGQKLQNGLGACQAPAPGFPNFAVSRNPASESDRQYYDLSPSGTGENLSSVSNTKKYHSLPDIHRDQHVSEKSSQWDNVTGYGSSISRIPVRGLSYSNSGSRSVAPLAFNELSSSSVYGGALSSQMNPPLDSGSFWYRQPSEQFGLDKNSNSESKGIGRLHTISQEASFVVNSEARLLQSFRYCIVKLLKLEGSDWLFGQSDGADEELIDCVAARERFLYEAETRVVRMKEPPPFSPDRRSGSGMKNDSNFANVSVSSVPHCGEGCIWRSDLIVSFGVWCIHRILDLSLMESRPELWGKYTYVLNRLQGIIDPAFSKPRIPMPPCFCLQIPQAFQQKRSSPQIANGMLPPAAKPGKGKSTTAAMLLDMVKDVEMAISSRKGRTGTAAGDVAFPKGKENLASVLKRYKRRLSNKPVATLEVSRKLPAAASVPYSS